MNREFGLKLLSQIMGWDKEESNIAKAEFDWLMFMSAYKYDGYRDYLAGARFIEHLCAWLQQFEITDRNSAYGFIKEKLIYFSPEEIQRLIEMFYPDVVQIDLINKVATSLNIPKYRIWSTNESIKEYKKEKRKTLFMGLSDGARIDAMRRACSGTLSHEQIVITSQPDFEKWKGLLKKLREDLNKIDLEKDYSNEKFSSVYLIDDFVGSGTSLLPDPDNTGGKLSGKLCRFAESLGRFRSETGEFPFEDDFRVIVHHYVGTECARLNLNNVYQKVSNSISECGLKEVKFTYGMCLPEGIVINDKSSDEFSAICQKYYNKSIEGDGTHGSQSGTKSKMYGYANCGLPVVIEHNTPNNSLPLIWAETSEIHGEPQMRPLFRRRERHSDLQFRSGDGIN